MCNEYNIKRWARGREREAGRERRGERGGREREFPFIRNHTRIYYHNYYDNENVPVNIHDKHSHISKII